MLKLFKNTGISLLLVVSMVLQSGCAFHTISSRELGREVHERYDGPVEMTSTTSSTTSHYRHRSHTRSTTTYECYRDNVVRFEVLKQNYYENTGAYYVLGGLGVALMGGLFVAANDRDDDFFYEPSMDVIGISLLVAGAISTTIGLVALATPEPEEEISPSVYYDYEDVGYREYVSCE